ncbi:TPA: hypothetical protein DEP96_02190 [Candidatus Uhrbacteria bacterium]|nr:hypothetical protein [Candidatus Uhrbacteria bacterium]
MGQSLKEITAGAVGVVDFVVHANNEAAMQLGRLEIEAAIKAAVKYGYTHGLAVGDREGEISSETVERMAEEFISTI